jgi:hypothetical protein
MEKMYDENCDEKTAQKNINEYATTHQKSHDVAAIALMQTNDHYKQIYEKIDHLFDIADDPNQQFTEEDLSDSWYVNATCGKETLLSCTYQVNLSCIQLQKIKTLIDAGVDVRNSINNSLLNRICHHRKEKIGSIKSISLMYKNLPGLNDKSLNLLKDLSAPTVQLEEFQLKQLLTIANLLLEHGADPNFQLSDEHNSPLIEAVAYSIDKEYAHLLVWYNADPCKIVVSPICCGYTYERKCSAFDLETTGWLKKVVDEKQQTIFKCWLFKQHDFGELTLLQDIMSFIRYKIWEVGKNSFKAVQSEKII